MKKFIISSLATSIEKNTEYDFINNIRFAFLFEKRKQDGLFYKASYEYSAENFNPGMASLLRERHHNIYTSVSKGKFNSKKDNGLFRYKRWIFLDSDLYFSPDMSRVISWYSSPSWQGTFFSGDQIRVFAIADYESVIKPIEFTDNVTIQSGEYFNYGFGASYTQGSQRKFKAPISAQYKGFFDGLELRFNIEPTLNINEHFNISLRWKSSYLNFENRNNSEWVNVVQGKFNWAYNLHLSGGIIGQYNSITHKFVTSARLRYNFKDGHDLYVVYNQDYNLDRNLMMTQISRFQNRIFTLKYLYTFFK